ncbi:uncharacterized protein LOC127281302 [Leptopilina boulardi]|uniref:uncharacterized protein LOC127281302 n=1 Tax=Leptopilina boulardi TaxID=63433 RepID=UPI0021F54A0C|nr:uncharacterized protein LOC127281302 [Leptopilina boulardi]
MNSKKGLKSVQNFYDGENVGRDSPAALLDMLAEVASQTLHSEKEQSEKSVVNKSKIKSECLKRKNQDLTYSLVQLISMPMTQLIKQFSIFTSDELKRQYSYVCTLMPDCEQKYTSFASESKARMSIKAHLEDHLEYLKSNNETYTTFTVNTGKKMKTKLQNKKTKVPRIKKPQEILNKENKDIKIEKPTNYLRKILTNELKSPTEENSIDMNVLTENDNDDSNEIDAKVLDDHSYYESTKDNELPDIENDSNEIVPKTGNENIMLMVVQSDGVHMKEVPYLSEKRDDLNQEPIYLPEPVQTEEVYARNMESPVPAKPKGKAKFIGTSREEKEMALLLMDRIKKKGNPSGNNLQCRICDPPRTFTAPTTLVSHYRSHAGIKPYECRICRSVFTRRHSLKYHMLIHQNQTRFTCADCGKKFRHPSHFREHRRRHTGEAPFGCPDCPQRFKTRNTYKRHLKTRHGKVLTTSGELLHLSEEDFQKVRTSRKKKPTIIEIPIIDENITAPESILPEYDESNCDIEENVNENYHHHQFTSNDDGTVWMSENIAHIINKEEKLNNFQITDDIDNNVESRVCKTDFLETEDNENESFNSRHHLFDRINQPIDNCNEVEENSIILDGTIETDLEFMKTNTQILYETNENEEIYNEYDNQIENVGEEILGYEEEILQDIDVIHEVQIENEDNSHDFNDSSVNVFCDNEEEEEEESENPYEQKILKIEENPLEEEEDFVHKEIEEDEEEGEEILPTIDYENNSESEDIKEMKITSQINENAFSEKCFLNNDDNNDNVNNSEAKSVFNLNLDQKEKVIVEPCGIPISPFQSQSAFHITKDGKMTLFGKQTQTINLMQNGSAILFLSNGTELTKNYFKINQNGILVKELKTLPINAAASDK